MTISARSILATSKRTRAIRTRSADGSVEVVFRHVERRNGGRSLENAVLLTEERCVHAYYAEWGQLVAFRSRWIGVRSLCTLIFGSGLEPRPSVIERPRLR